jgi:DNA-binding CsgD family transcriptional regulator
MTPSGSVRRTEPEEAVALWQGLIDGRWSLLEQIDNDARRWTLARNEPPTPKPTLNRREQEVVDRVALGYSNKLIAYTLNLSTGTVANLIACASRKLGAHSRVNLIQQLVASINVGRRTRDAPGPRAPILVSNAPDPHAVPFGLQAWRLHGKRDYALLSFPVSTRDLWAPLSPRERTVASEVLTGQSTAVVAQRLDVAPRTVANHLASIFRKLRIQSRAQLASLLARNLTEK